MKRNQSIPFALRRFLYMFSCCLLCFAGNDVYGQLSGKNFKIYSVKEKKEVTLDDLVSQMDDHDVLFFGEEHNDSVGHYLEKTIFEKLNLKYPGQLALSLEMFDRDVQTVMDEYLLGYIREKNFVKDARAWTNYKDYRPMVETAKSNALDVICANAPSRYTNLAGRKGQEALTELSDDARLYFAPLPYDTASGKYYEKLQGLMGHNSTPTIDTAKKIPAASPMGSFNLIVAQSLWDATMAYSIWEYRRSHKHHKIMHVNGRFHSDEGFAVVTQLGNYNESIRSLVISSGPDDSFPTIDWTQFDQLGDYVIITDPGVPKSYKD